jgi:REP element-mobilizing transposase RayT
MNESASVATLAYVLMPDHFHWLIQLHKDTDITSSVSSVKSVSAHRINKYLGKNTRVWQRGFYDHALRKEEDLIHVARYIVANPLRAGFVKSLSDYSLWDAVWV